MLGLMWGGAVWLVPDGVGTVTSVAQSREEGTEKLHNLSTVTQPRSRAADVGHLCCPIQQPPATCGWSQRRPNVGVKCSLISKTRHETTHVNSSVLTSITH